MNDDIDDTQTNITADDLLEDTRSVKSVPLPHYDDDDPTGEPNDVPRVLVPDDPMHDSLEDQTEVYQQGRDSIGMA